MKLPGWGPQSTILGMLLFLVLINAAGFKKAIKNTGEIITKPFNRRGPVDKIHLNFIDDLTVAEAIKGGGQLNVDRRFDPILIVESTIFSGIL